MLEFLSKHYQWIFSGIGFSIIGLFIYRRGSKIRYSNRINQKIGNRSSGIQAGRDIKSENIDNHG